jgi:hypothetical protein
MPAGAADENPAETSGLVFDRSQDGENQHRFAGCVSEVNARVNRGVQKEVRIGGMLFFLIARLRMMLYARFPRDGWRQGIGGQETI